MTDWVLSRETTETLMRKDGVTAAQIRAASAIPAYPAGKPLNGVYVLLGHRGDIGELSWVQFRALLADVLDGKVKVRP